MKRKNLQRALSWVTALALSLSLFSVSAFAAEPENTAPVGSVVNTSGDGGENGISLTKARSFKASVPVDMTEAEALEAAKTVTWFLNRDEEKAYLDADLYPNQSAGGALDSWLCTDGATPLFSNVVSSAETVDGQVYLTVTFESGIYFYTQNRQTKEWTPDASAPHSNGGAYLDVCGYFDLTAVQGDKALGSAPVKIVPYDNFHTMAEINASLDELVAYAAAETDLYVEKFSMGKSQGDNGLESLDMPYLIVARDRAAVDGWLALTEKAECEPDAVIAGIENGTLGDYQVPVMYSNVHANEVAAADGVLQFAQMLVEAAAGDGKIDYDKLTGFTAEGEAELAAQMGPAGEADSVAVPDLVKDSATYLGYIKGKNADGTTASVSTVVDLETYYTIETETVDVDELLDDVFFLIVPEENVEGRTYVTRTSSGGFDLNRDNSFQTQAETQNMTRLIGIWNPVSFTEFHGRVQAFQCEPCDPPHEPNFEYDLLAEHLMTGGEALGIAAVANNDGHNSYVIPQRDYLSYTGEKNADGSDQVCWYDPWDDMSTSYTPQYAMLHGTVAYTVEVPAYDDYMVEALAYGQLGQSDYIAENKESYLMAQTRIFQRGVTNANSNAYELVGQWFCDQYDIEGAEAGLFRPVYDGEGQNGNFYPECYIIPLDGENQSNLQAADDMLEYLTRNDVKIWTADASFSYDGVEYPAGTAVISMYQAKRSVANGVLYNGTVINDWPVLYSEGITAFDLTRGFDMVTCAEPAAYASIMAACSESDSWTVASSFTGETGGQVILCNASEDSTAAVNALLKAGKTVSLITEGENKGSFLCDYADYQSVADEYLISAAAVEGEAPAAAVIAKAPVVYICGKGGESASGFVKTPLTSGSYEYNYDRQAMELLGFTVTEDLSQADLIIGAAAPGEAELAAIRSGVPYIGYGRRVANAAASLFEDGALVRNTVSSESMDALIYVTYPTDSMVTASYAAEGDDILYGYGAAYYAAIPEGAQVLVRLDGSKAPLEGFLCSDGEHYNDFLNNSIQAISYQGKGKDGADLDVVLFANTLTNKVHQRDEFNFISNTAFSAVAEMEGYSDVAGDAWYAGAVQQASAKGLISVSGNLFQPEAAFTADLLGVELTVPATGAITRLELVEAMWQAAGSPAGTADLSGYTDGADVSSDAVLWAVEQGVLLGRSSGALDLGADLTRAEAAVLLDRWADL